MKKLLALLLFLAALLISIGIARSQTIATNNTIVNLILTPTDPGGSMEDGKMQFSNNGTDWSTPELFAAIKKNWDITLYGGSETNGPRTIYARFRDAAGNWSLPATAVFRFDNIPPVGGTVTVEVIYTVTFPPDHNN